MKQYSPAFRIRRGFTMIEMLVTLAITIVLMLFVGQIFSQVSDAAKSGIAISHVIESARIITGQISDDAANMIGSSDGGFLIIQTHDLASAQLDEESAASGPYFMDQVMWTRLRGDLEPMVPGLDNGYSNSADDASHVRVYYGHARKTQSNGSDSGDFGSSANGGMNQYASQWVLGRHALFLAEGVPATANFAASAAHGASISGVNAKYWTGYGGSQVLKFGVSDKANQTLAEINTAGTITVDTVGFGSTFANRLRVNPAPNAPDFEGWAVAQMTPILATGVSDIIVEYANVTTGSGAINWTRGNLVCTSSTTNWPDLIRIRFRLHGPRGAIGGADGEPGVMYEKIIPVKQ